LKARCYGFLMISLVVSTHMSVTLRYPNTNEDLWQRAGTTWVWRMEVLPSNPGRLQDCLERDYDSLLTITMVGHVAVHEDCI
jgi:hypothetical protein